MTYGGTGSGVTALTPGNTVNVNWTLTPYHKLTIDRNTTFTFSNDAIGKTIRVYVTQSPSGWEITWPTGVANFFKNDDESPDPGSGATTEFLITKLGTNNGSVLKLFSSTTTTGSGASVLQQSPQTTSVRETLNQIGSVTGATNVDFSLGNVVKMTLTGDAVLTVTNPPTTGLSGRIRLAITGNGTATLGITNVVWGAAGTPSTIASGKTLMVTMDTLNGGGNWLAGWDLFSPTAPPPPPPPATIGSWTNVHPQTASPKLIASSVSGDLTMRAGFASDYSDGAYNSSFFVGLAGTNAEFPTSGNHTYEYGSNTKFSTIISPTSGQRVVLDHFKFVARIQDVFRPTPPLKCG